MSEINLPPFYVGQKVVAVCNTQSWNKGAEFIINGICRPCCQWVVDIGEKIPYNSIIHCEECSFQLPVITGDVWWAYAKLFSPIEENFQSISLEKVLEKETKLISVN